MKPSPHQDAADLVARLDLTDARKCPFDGDNNLLPSDPCPICGDTGEFNSDPAPSKCISFSQQTVLDEAKAFIEQQAKALSEASQTCNSYSNRALAAEASLADAIKERDEARADALALYQLGADVHVCEHCSAWMTDDERARVDVTLCPREAYGSDRFPDEPCFKHRAWLVEVDRAESRSFLNSVPNKEPK